MTHKELLKKWHISQASLRAELYSENKEIKLVFNGNVELIELNISDHLSAHEIQQILPQLINMGIKKISYTTQDEFIKFRKQQSF